MVSVENDASSQERPILENNRSPSSLSLSEVPETEEGGGLVRRGNRFVARLLRPRGIAPGTANLIATFNPPPRKVRWLMGSFIFFVVLPAIASVFYFAVLAAPQYSVEARLIVRQADSGSAGSLGAAAAALGGSFSYSPQAQNSYVVAQYIRSRAAVDDLLPIVDLRAIFRHPEADFWARLKDDASEEDLVEYWLKMVRAYVDGPSSIVTVEVRAFRADDALKIAQSILVVSERLVNQMSQRAREDVMKDSVEEVRRADLVVRSTLTDLQNARDSEGMLDPVKAADETGKLLAQLMAEKIRIEAEAYFLSRSLEKSAPTVRQLNSRLQIIDSQIADLKSSLAGKSSSSSNIASSLRKFEHLEVQKLVADKSLDFAEEGLERARVKAERQNLYFMVFVPPSLPSKAMFPRRLAYSLLLPLVFLIFWGIAALLWAAVEDHRV